MNNIPNQAHRAISKRAYHKKLVAFEAPKPHPFRKPKRSARQRRRVRWLAKGLACQPAVGTEQECEGVLLTRANKRPPDFMAENDSGITCVLRKQKTGGWDVLLPGGGFHSFKTKRAACRFIAQLVRLEETDAA